MRFTTAFNKMLAIPGATVSEVHFTPEGVVVVLRRRSKLLTCPCGFATRATYDRSTRSWRHLDLGACRLLLQSEIRRLQCPRCERVRTEQVPWARPGAITPRTSKTWWRSWLSAPIRPPSPIYCGSRGRRCLVRRVVTDHSDDSRLNELYRIGVDEIFYRKSHRFLTVVANHDRNGAVVWTAEGKKSETLKDFYALLGDERKAQLEAVSLDLGIAYTKATTEEVPRYPVWAELPSSYPRKGEENRFLCAEVRGPRLPPRLVPLHLGARPPGRPRPESTRTASTKARRNAARGCRPGAR